MSTASHTTDPSCDSAINQQMDVITTQLKLALVQPDQSTAHMLHTPSQVFNSNLRPACSHSCIRAVNGVPGLQCKAGSKPFQHLQCPIMLAVNAGAQSCYTGILELWHTSCTAGSSPLERCAKIHMHAKATPRCIHEENPPPSAAANFTVTAQHHQDPGPAPLPAPIAAVSAAYRQRCPSQDPRCFSDRFSTDSALIT